MNGDDSKELSAILQRLQVVTFKPAVIIGSGGPAECLISQELALGRKNHSSYAGA